MARSRIRPAVWSPPTAPAFEGVYATNKALDRLELWMTPGSKGPEDVAVDADGNIYAGVLDGRILRWRPGGGKPDEFSATHGRPLGIEIHPDGGLIVCDAFRGLHHIDEQGRVEILVDSFNGIPLKFTNNATIDTKGRIYFSDTSTRFGFDEYKLDLLEHRGNGRLFRYDPSSGKTELMLAGLYFANGVALAHDESYVLVAETGAYRVRRLWLSGTRQGSDDRIVDNLPGFPDNISHNGKSGDDALFWCAMPTPRMKDMDSIARVPALRHLAASLPDALQPKAKKYGLVLGFDEQGEIRHTLHGPAGAYAEITGVREHDGWLYLGSLAEPAIARVRVPGA